MNFNIKYKLVLSIGGVILCLLTACSNDTPSNNISLNNKTYFTSESTENTDSQDLSSVSQKFQPEGYNVLVNSLDAKTVLEYKKVNFPEKINNLKVTCIKLIDESTVLVSLYGEECVKEIGVYNFKKNVYVTYITLNNKDKQDGLDDETYIISAVTERYMILKLTRNNWGNTSIYLYDIKNNMISKIYDYSIDKKTGKNVYMNDNSIVIQNNSIYFDDFTYDENEKITVNLLKYDCDTKKVTTIMKEAQNPMLYNEDVVCITKNEDGKYKNIQSISKEKVHDIKVALREIISTGKSLYCVENKHTDKEKLTTEFQIKDLIKDNKILYTTRAIGWLRASDHFITWYDYEENTPCIYSIDLNSLLVFSDISDGMNSIFVKENYGLLFHSENGKNEYYFFNLKNN